MLYDDDDDDDDKRCQKKNTVAIYSCNTQLFPPTTVPHLCDSFIAVMNSGIFPDFALASLLCLVNNAHTKPREIWR